MKKANNSTLLIMNSIIILYNNFFFAIVEGYQNGFKKDWITHTMILSVIAYILITPISILTRNIIAGYIEKSSANEKKKMLLQVLGLIINIFIIITIMMAFTLGIDNPKFSESYVIVLVLASINAMTVNILFNKISMLFKKVRWSDNSLCSKEK